MTIDRPADRIAWMNARLPRAVLGLAAALALLAAAPPSAMADAPFSWVAKVDEEIITNYDLEQRYLLLKAESNNTDDEALRTAAKEQLIDEALKFREASRRGVKLKDGAVEDALKRVARGDTKSYLARLEAAGVAPASVRRRLEVAINWNTLLRQEHLSKIEPSDAEVETELAAAKAAPSGPTRYQIARVFVATQGGAISQAAQRAEAARRTITNCSNMEAKAGQFGRVDTRAFSTAQLKRMGMPEPTVTQLVALKPGQSLRPLRSPEGFHVFFNCGQTGRGRAAPSEDSVRSALMNRKAEFVSESLVADLRRDALIEVAR